MTTIRRHGKAYLLAFVCFLAHCRLLSLWCQCNSTEAEEETSAGQAEASPHQSSLADMPASQLEHKEVGLLKGQHFQVSSAASIPFLRTGDIGAVTRQGVVYIDRHEMMMKIMGKEKKSC